MIDGTNVVPANDVPAATPPVMKMPPPPPPKMPARKGMPAVNADLERDLLVELDETEQKLVTIIQNASDNEKVKAENELALLKQYRADLPELMQRLRAIKQEAIELQAVLNQGTDVQKQSAKDRINALKKETNAVFNKRKKERLTPLEDKLAGLRAQLDKADEKYAQPIGQAQQMLAKLIEEQKELQEQEEEYKNDNDGALFLQQVQESLRVYPENIRLATLGVAAQTQALATEKASLSKQIKILKEDVATAKKWLSPLQALRDAVPVLPAEIPPPPRDALDISDWKTKGIIKGQHRLNLAKFIYRADETAEEIQENYQPQAVFKKYNEIAARDPQFDERIILGIACGYIARPENERCASHLKPLEGALINQQAENNLQNLLTKLYAQYEKLKETAKIALDAPAIASPIPHGMEAIKASIQGLVTPNVHPQVRDNAAPVPAVNQPAPLKAPAALKRAADPAISPEQAQLTREEKIQAIEDARIAKEQANFANEAAAINPLQRGPNKSPPSNVLNVVPADNANLQQEIEQQRLEHAALLARLANAQAQVEQQTKALVEAAAKAQAFTAPLQTPQEIIAQYRVGQSNVAKRAVEAYVKQHGHLPDSRVAFSWGFRVVNPQQTVQFRNDILAALQQCKPR